MPCDRIVLVFARAPRDERRAKPIVDVDRGRAVEALHDRLLKRAIAVARASGVDTRLVTTGNPRSFVVAPDVEVTLQRGNDFGERLENAVADAFASGWREVVVIGSDTPQLTAHDLQRAFAELGRSSDRRAVIGPARDGGYFLLALNAFTPHAFRGIPLGTTRAGDATAAALERAGFAITTLRPLRDVDDADDVRWLCAGGGSLRRAALAVLAPSDSTATRARTIATAVFVAAIRTRGPPVLPSTHS